MSYLAVPLPTTGTATADADAVTAGFVLRILHYFLFYAFEIRKFIYFKENRKFSFIKINDEFSTLNSSAMHACV